MATEPPLQTSPENLRQLRSAKGLKQSELAELLGLEKHHVSKIETGVRTLSESEKILLDWYFFNRTPRGVSTQSPDLSSILEFDPLEWQVIEILAKKAGFHEPRQWIAAQIRAYLDHNPKAQEAKTDLKPQPPENSA